MPTSIVWFGVIPAPVEIQTLKNTVIVFGSPRPELIIGEESEEQMIKY